LKTLVEVITPGILMDNAEDYFMYRNEKDEITGLWFFDKESKDHFSEKLKRFALESSHFGAYFSVFLLPCFFF
jgi:hypothetical protein